MTNLPDDYYPSPYDVQDEISELPICGHCDCEIEEGEEDSEANYIPNEGFIFEPTFCKECNASLNNPPMDNTLNVIDKMTAFYESQLQLMLQLKIVQISMNEDKLNIAKYTELKNPLANFYSHSLATSKAKKIAIVDEHANAQVDFIEQISSRNYLNIA